MYEHLYEENYEIQVLTTEKSFKTIYFVDDDGLEYEVSEKKFKGIPLVFR